MNVYIGGAKGDYSALRGPATEGFHVPTYDDWHQLSIIMRGLGLTTGDDRRINLHMPLAGYRSSINSSLLKRGSECYYWSSSPYSASSRAIWTRELNSSYTSMGGTDRADGNSIRCFKNSYEEPTSSWTVIQGTLGSAGIFWNHTEGLISITSDGTTGYTIQDKNLGATTVYSDGDTLSATNCGKFYQWGNNYGFAWTGSITTSSTQVDASAYGPGNYYSSSTFIKRSSSPYDWSSVQNDNLRGGVTGVVMVPAELKNAYIGEFVPYTPNANTLLYLPLKSDLNDYSGNNKNFSVYTGSVSYTDNMVKLNNATIRCSSMALTGTGDFTILCYNKNGGAISLWNDTDRYPKLWLRALGLEIYNDGWYKATDSGYDGICFLVGVRKNNRLYFYRNGTLITSNTSVPSINIYGGPGMYIGGYANTSDNGYYGSVIVENRAWTADEILKFYNDTKSTYGL